MDNKPLHGTAHGMESYDTGPGHGDNQCIGALSIQQQEKLNRFKIQTRSENERYLQNHPEVECLLGAFIGDVLNKRPQNIQDFAAEYFTQPSLNEIVEMKMEDRKRNMRQNKILQEN